MVESEHRTSTTGLASLLELGIDPDQSDTRTNPHAALAAAAEDGYRVLALVGQGGFGQVWRAVQLNPRRDVALKCITPDQSPAQARQAVKMLQLESELLSRLSDPRIVALQRTVGQGESCFLALEFIDGDPINEHCDWNEVSVEGRLDLIEQVLLAVAKLHALGIVHGDIKPSNILLRDRNTPVLVDFGMAADFTRQQSRLTPPQYLGGTPAYMAPELIDKSATSLEPTADVFALSMLALQLLDAATSPWDVPKTVRRALNRGLTADPRRRAPSAEELLIDFRRARAYVNLMHRRPVQIAFASLVFIVGTLGWFVIQPVAEPGLNEISGQEPFTQFAPPTYSEIVGLLRDDQLLDAKQLLGEVDAADRSWEWEYLNDWAESGEAAISDRVLGQPNTFDASWSSDGQALAYSTQNYEVWAMPPGRDAFLVDSLQLPPQFVAIDNAGEQLLVTTSQGTLFQVQRSGGETLTAEVPLPQPILTVRMVESPTARTAWAFMKKPYRLQRLRWDDTTSTWHAAEVYGCENTVFGINPDFPALLVQTGAETRRITLLDTFGETAFEADLPKSIVPMSYAYDDVAKHLYIANYYGRVWRRSEEGPWEDLMELPTEQTVLSMDIAPEEKRLFLAAEDAYVVDTESGRILLRLNDEDRLNIILKVRWDETTRTLHALTSDHARIWGNRRAVVLR